MALDQSALTDLLDALRAGGDLDFMREAMQLVLQALIELEATEVIGAARHQRADTRTTHRNGNRSRLLSTKAGDVELAIPKLRHGSFFPALLEPRRRIDRALWAVIMEAFVHGVSTRKVDDLVAALWRSRSSCTGLTPLIAVVYDDVDRAAALHRHAQRVGDELGARVGRHRPADDPAAEMERAR